MPQCRIPQRFGGEGDRREVGFPLLISDQGETDGPLGRLNARGEMTNLFLSPHGCRDGILRLASVGAFAVAAVNVGASGLITVSANTGAATLPLSLTVCETNPQNGACLAPPAATVQTQINTNATPTFSVFASSTSPIAFNPATNRIQVCFDGGGGGGGTSVAVCTAPLCP